MYTNCLYNIGYKEKAKKIDEWYKKNGYGEVNKMSNEKLAVGDKYLSIKVNFGGQNFSLPAFKNKDKKVGSTEPDYKGQNIAVWISTKKNVGKDAVKVEDI